MRCDPCSAPKKQGHQRPCFFSFSDSKLQVNDTAIRQKLDEKLTNQPRDGQPSILLSELWKQFKSEKVKAGRWRNSTIRNHTPKFNDLLQFVGDVPVNQITKTMIREYRKLLDRLPPNFVKKGYPDLSVVDPNFTSMMLNKSRGFGVST